MRKVSSTNSINENILKENCPLFFTLSKVGSRWKSYITWKLSNKTLRFAKIKQEIPAITERMLILSLKE
jgi:DNA-binding HxlR family transcriptional regulator